MNGATREQIMNALLLFLQTQCGNTFLTYSRQFIDFQTLAGQIAGNQLGDLKFPALMLYDGGMHAEKWTHTGRGRPSIRTLTRHIIIYAYKPGAGTPAGMPAPAGAGGTILHPLEESVEAAIEGKPDNVRDNVLQLGYPPKVWYVWLEGEGVLIPGDIDPTGLCMVTMPIKILIP